MWKNNIAEPTHIWGEKNQWAFAKENIALLLAGTQRLEWKRVGKWRSSRFVFSEQGIPLKTNEESNSMELKKNGIFMDLKGFEAQVLLNSHFLLDEKVLTIRLPRNQD